MTTSSEFHPTHTSYNENTNHIPEVTNCSRPSTSNMTYGTNDHTGCKNTPRHHHPTNSSTEDHTLHTPCNSYSANHYASPHSLCHSNSYSICDTPRHSPRRITCSHDLHTNHNSHTSPTVLYSHNEEAIAPSLCLSPSPNRELPTEPEDPNDSHPP